MKGKTVQDWMHRGVISCHPETSVEEVARIIDSQNISGLVVVDEEGDAVGVISQTDLVDALFVQPYLRYWRGMAAEHLMTRPVITVSPDTPVTEAVRILQARNIHRLVVAERAGNHLKPVGILSVTDLARHVAETETW